MRPPFKVKDIIKHLQTMNQDMEVWSVWDESGEYTPVLDGLGRIDWISDVCKDGKYKWKESIERGKGRAVCVLLSSITKNG